MNDKGRGGICQGKNKIDVGMIKREYRKNMPESYVLKLEEILKEGGNFE